MRYATNTNIIKTDYIRFNLHWCDSQPLGIAKPTEPNGERQKKKAISIKNVAARDGGAVHDFYEPTTLASPSVATASNQQCVHWQKKRRIAQHLKTSKRKKIKRMTQAIDRGTVSLGRTYTYLCRAVQETTTAGIAATNACRSQLISQWQAPITGPSMCAIQGATFCRFTAPKMATRRHQFWCYCKSHNSLVPSQNRKERRAIGGEHWHLHTSAMPLMAP